MSLDKVGRVQLTLTHLGFEIWHQFHELDVSGTAFTGSIVCCFDCIHLIISLWPVGELKQRKNYIVTRFEIHNPGTQIFSG